MKVAESIAVLSMRKPYNTGVYMHIREDRAHQLRDELFDQDLREIQLAKTLKALRKEGYAIAKAHLEDPSLILIREPEVETVKEEEPAVAPPAIVAEVEEEEEYPVRGKKCTSVRTAPPSCACTWARALARRTPSAPIRDGRLLGACVL